jgi:hypothetical protein
LVKVFPSRESEWFIVFDQDVDFMQEAIKFAHIQNNVDIKFEKLILKSTKNDHDNTPLKI